METERFGGRATLIPDPGGEPWQLPVQELGPAVAHYEGLGFTVTQDPDGAGATAVRDGEKLHLRHSPGFDPGTEAGCIYLKVDDPDLLWAEWSRPEIGGRGRAPRVSSEDGSYAGSHIDPDGNCIMFGKPAGHA
jgi:hypothetical protein